MLHYIAINGLPGCLPDSCQACDTKRDAVEWLTSLYQLGRKGVAELNADGIHYIGNDVLEVIECNCADPAMHNDY